MEFKDWRVVDGPEGSDEFVEEFTSAFSSPYAENNTVPLRVFVPSETQKPVPVVLILHYWGAVDLKGETSLATELNRRGIAAAIMTLPYHMSRTPAGRRSGEMAIEPDPAKLSAVMTQAVFDTRRSIDFLVSRPEFKSQQIGLAGISLGGVVAALTYAVDPRITDVGFIVGGVDLADTLWNSSRVVSQRDLLRRRGITLPKLREALAPVEPTTYLPRAQPGTAFVIAGKYDTVIPRSATLHLIESLPDPQVLWLDTGHYGGIFVQHRLLREVANYFQTRFAQRSYLAPKKLVAPTLRIGAKLEYGTGLDIGAGIDLIQFDGRGDNVFDAFITPRGIQGVLAHRVWEGLAISASYSTRGFGVGLFWSSVL